MRVQLRDASEKDIQVHPGAMHRLWLAACAAYLRQLTRAEARTHFNAQARTGDLRGFVLRRATNMPYRKPKYFYFDEKGKFVFDAFFSSEYEDGVSGDSGDRVTGETDSENISSSTVNRDEQITETDEKSADECQENAATDSSETVSGDSSDDTVTADSRCENNCQPVNRCQPAAENNKKPVQNCGGNRKKHGKKSKKKKGGKKH